MQILKLTNALQVVVRSSTEQILEPNELEVVPVTKSKEILEPNELEVVPVTKSKEIITPDTTLETTLDTILDTPLEDSDKTTTEETPIPIVEADNLQVNSPRRVLMLSRELAGPESNFLEQAPMASDVPDTSTEHMPMSSKVPATSTEHIPLTTLEDPSTTLNYSKPISQILEPIEHEVEPVTKTYNETLEPYALEAFLENDNNMTQNCCKDEHFPLRGYAERRRGSRFGTEAKLGDLPHHVLIFRLMTFKSQKYRAFCAGSIIGELRVLSSANCFLTNRKSHRFDYKHVRVAAGVLQTVIERSRKDHHQQWRIIMKVHSQRFYRFPAYNLALLIMHKPWYFNDYVKAIPYESSIHDFDGVCMATAVKATKSWSAIKYVYTEEVEMIKRRTCEQILQRSVKLYFCTAFDNRNKYAYSETEGGGLVCYYTGDPAEVDPEQGILVGVTSVVSLGLPNLHVRIGNHAKWVRDNSCRQVNNIFLNIVLTLINIVL